jgi:cell division protein FtsI (penicillin-binding protein 3)
VSRPPVHRLVVLLAVFAMALGGVVGRLGVLQLRESVAYAAMGQEQRLRVLDLPAIRGRILDRDATPLAMSLEARDVYVDPTQVVDPAGQARVIAEILELAPKDVRAALSRDDTTFVYLARHVDRDVAERLAMLRLPGVGLLPVQKRYYPAGPVAAQVLGFVGVDGEGLTGLEARYESILAGQPGERTVEVSAQGQEITGGVDVVTEPRPGADLILTIDRQIQFQAQRALQRAVRDNDAKGGTIVVMDPITGDVYAMASAPSFDPNRFTEFPSDSWSNRAVTDTWEPGSVNKVITAAAALETGAVSPTEEFAVPATRRIEEYTIHDAHPHGVMSMTLGDIVAESSNVGSSLVADRVGSDGMAETFSRFGFGEPTGIGFPGEASGLMPRDEVWSDLTRATVSYGAGVAVTPLQMASVYATVANGGMRVQPRLVRSIVEPDGTVVEAEPSIRHRVVRPETADVLTRMLAYAVQDGTGENAQIPGYQVAGKTGTAKKLDANGRYTQRYVASFIGFLPASRPRIVVAAILDEPRTIYGGVAAAPLFQEVARYAIQRLGIEPAPVVKLPPHVLQVP